MDKLYTIQEVATKLNVSDKTLRRWEEAGKFSPSRTLGNQRRYSLEDLQILDAIKHGTVDNQKDLLTVNQAGKLCGVTPTTILRWENIGKIHPFITSGNTYYPRQKLMEKMDELKRIYTEPNIETVPVPLGSNLSQGTLLERNSRVQPEEGSSADERRVPNVATKLTPLEPKQNSSEPCEASVSNFGISGHLLNALITLILIFSYHLFFNQSSVPISPQTGSVRGTSTVAPDPRLDDLIVKFQDHLSAEMLKNARPTNTTVKVESTSLVTGTSTMLKGNNQISVSQDQITSTTPITTTFTSDYAPAKKYWVIAEQGSFTLHTDFPVSSDSSFNYQFLAPQSTPSASTTSKLTNPQVKL